jgi:hypothetical protein
VKELLREVKQKANQKFEVLRLLKEECKDIQDKLDKMREVSFLFLPLLTKSLFLGTREKERRKSAST